MNTPAELMTATPGPGTFALVDRVTGKVFDMHVLDDGETLQSTPHYDVVPATLDVQIGFIYDGEKFAPDTN